MPDHLITFLADRDEPCPLCGYNLRNLQTDHCPECGRQLHLTVGLTEPAIGAWIAALVATLLPAGLGLLIIVILCIAVAYSPHADLIREISRMPGSGQYILVHLLASVPLSVIVLTNRKRFIRLRQDAQRGLALVAWVAIAVSIVCVFVTVNR